MDHAAEHPRLLVPEGQHARQPVPKKRILIGHAHDVSPRSKAWKALQEQIPQSQPKDPRPAIGGDQLAHLHIEPLARRAARMTALRCRSSTIRREALY
jgi:hypothetical protein